LFLRVPNLKSFKKECVKLQGPMRYWCDIRDFVLRLRTQLRFGRLSRCSLQLLRFEWRGEHVECDWVARPPDEWDQKLASHVGERNASVQALEDALAMRDLLFFTLKDVSSATFHVYRETEDGTELIIAGTVARPEPIRWAASSLAMRAKLCGLQFNLDNGRLLAFQTE
jgi:hypothetical protein